MILIEGGIARFIFLFLKKVRPEMMEGIYA